MFGHLIDASAEVFELGALLPCGLTVETAGHACEVKSHLKSLIRLAQICAITGEGPGRLR